MVTHVLHSCYLDRPAQAFDKIAGLLVGRPLATMLMNAEATVTTCNIYTKNLADVSKKADILISAVGKKGLITGSMVKKGAIVIDAGVDFVNNDLFGDVDQKTVIQKASFLTPTPGGVGPLTVSHLLSNVVLCAERRFLPTAKTSRNSSTEENMLLSVTKYNFLSSSLFSFNFLDNSSNIFFSRV